MSITQAPNGTYVVSVSFALILSLASAAARRSKAFIQWRLPAKLKRR